MKKSSRAGFTLAEVLLSILVVAILLTSFLAVFGPAAFSIRRAISIEDADRMVSSLENELATLRDDEQSQGWNTAFDKAFEWIQGSNDPQSAILLFNYRGDASSVVNGELEAYPDDDGAPGEDYVIQTAVRWLGDSDSDLDELLEASDGLIYAVQISQLVPDQQGRLIPTTSSSGLESADGSIASSADSFEDAVIICKADFYSLPTSDANYVNGGFQDGESLDEKFGQPLFSRNLAVTR